MQEKNSKQKAVSPVVGVILMVAITVILAAVIGTFVLDLGSDVEESATAGLSIDEDSEGDVTATLVSLQNAESVIVTGGGSGNLTEVGDTVTIDSGTHGGDQITFVAESPDGQETVVQTYTPNEE